MYEGQKSTARTHRHTEKISTEKWLVKGIFHMNFGKVRIDNICWTGNLLYSRFNEILMVSFVDGFFFILPWGIRERMYACIRKLKSHFVISENNFYDEHLRIEINVVSQMKTWNLSLKNTQGEKHQFLDRIFGFISKYRNRASLIEQEKYRVTKNFVRIILRHLLH